MKPSLLAKTGIEGSQADIPVPMDIRPLIYEIRGRQVMLDRDLAALYGVLTKNLNKAVKRNVKRFPEDFMFQLTKEECLRFQSGTLETGTIANMDTLRFQNGTSKQDDQLRFQNGTSKSVRGGNRYASYAFTENGIAMLSSVLRSERAIAINVRIMREFTTMRRALASMAPMQSRLEAIERRQISDQSRNEERFDQIFAKMSEGDLPLAQIFYQGKFWDAKSLLIKFIRRAKKELIVIDAYPGVATLDMLAKRGRGVKVELVTHSNGELAESDFEAFAKQYGNFTKTICGICHDRFIIADQKEIYWSGASLKDAGRLTFAAAKLGAEMIPGLLASIRKATSATNNYKKGGRK